LCISSLEGKPPSPQTLRRYVGGSPDRTLAELRTTSLYVNRSRFRFLEAARCT
jgi:hypothetical protein